MLQRRRPTSVAVLLLWVGSVASTTVRGDDAPGSPPPVPAPSPDAETTAALARADALDSQWYGLFDKGKYTEATPAAREALAIRERVLPKDHPDVAASLDNLATILRNQGAYAEARPLYDRALAINEKSLGKDHPYVAMSLNNLAVLLTAQGAYKDARPLCERALAINEKALGVDHVEVGTNLNNLAELLREEGAYEQARPIYERAIAIYEKRLGADHPNVAAGLNNLALLLAAQGAYAEARPIYERSISILERALGRDHPQVATSLNNLGTLLKAEGVYAEARPLYERALAIQEKAFGNEHPDIAATLNNLGVLLDAQGDDEAAQRHYLRALAIREKTLGVGHPAVAETLNNLAALHAKRRRFGEARPLYERALAIREKSVGLEHPAVAANLSNLAGVRQAKGEYGAARALYERALAIIERTLGVDHPEYAAILENVASLLEAQGAYEEARPIYERALAMTEAHAHARLSALSAQQRLGLMRSTRYRLDHWVRFAPHLGLSAYPEVLRFRGLVGRAEAAERVLSRHAGDDDRRSLESLQAATRRAARLANQMPESRAPEARTAWQRQYAEACAERERLTLELSKRSAPLRAARERLDLGLADVQARLAPDTALVDLLRVADRYLAWIVRGKGDPIRLDVGAAEKIDEACVEFISAITDDGLVTEKGSALRALTWERISAHLGADVARVVIVPDAALAAVPFAALPGRAPGRYLIDDLAISYVMNAQDLVPPDDTPAAGVGALLVGDVDYEHARGGTKDESSAARPLASRSLDRAPRGGTFTPLPQTKDEIVRLRDRFGSAATTLLLGADATEARLRDAVRGKRFVHVATHGFAREDLLAGLYSRKVEDAWTSVDAERQLGAGHDPMLLSALAMAGANPRDGGAGDDGILTALESSYLDLDGVDLVTLSACETAKGTAESGDGVQGLVRAFQMAGSRRVIASLWKVDDEGTRRLMDGVYERMLRKESPSSPAEALREAAIALRDGAGASGKARFAAPRYWAAFVAYGR